MIIALSAIDSKQNAPTENTTKRVKNFLDYAASQEEAIIMFNASGMLLEIHFYASHQCRFIFAVAEEATIFYQVTKNTSQTTAPY